MKLETTIRLGMDVFKRALKDFTYTKYELSSALVLACSHGELEIVEVLLKRGVRSDHALSWAVHKGHLEIVKVLIAAGVDIHKRYDEAFIDAAVRGGEDIMQVLVEAGADVNARDGEALMSAVRGRHCATVKLLIKAGADIDDLAFIYACVNEDLPTVRVLAEAGANIFVNSREAFFRSRSKALTDLLEELEARTASCKGSGADHIKRTYCSCGACI